MTKLSESLNVYDETSKKFRESDASVTVHIKSLDKKAGKARESMLGIMPGTFYDAVMPETVESMWGPVPFKPLPAGTENKCKAVVHRYAEKLFTSSESYYNYVISAS